MPLPMTLPLLALALAAQPECLEAYGTTACGYHCQSAYGQVRCARSPEGACQAAYGQVVCWDPPRWVVHQFSALPEASCLASDGRIACGYRCVAAYGQVRCAQTPDGLCRAESGRVTCFDGIRERAIGDRLLRRHSFRP
jgi:hypothetical protein